MNRVLGNAFIIEGKRVTEVPENAFKDYAWFWTETTPVEFSYVKKTCPVCDGLGRIHGYKCSACNGKGEV